MIEQAPIDWLKANGFKHVGYWSSDSPRMQRSIRLERIPAIYAFVENGSLRYLGKATYLRSRLRGYNRSLRDETPRGFRDVHHGIRRAWHNSTIVDVWAYDCRQHVGETLHQLEDRWIKKMQPAWNVAGV